MRRNLQIAAGFVLPHLLAGALFYATKSIVASSQGGLLILSYFTILPLMMGLVSAACWKELKWGVPAHAAGALANFVILAGMAALFMHEGIICLIIVAPLLYAFLLLGTWIGMRLFQSGNRLQASLVPVLLLLLVIDARSPHEHHQVVTDSLLIHAPPERVWRYVVEVPTIRQPSPFWLFRLGLPAPVYTTATGHFVGAERQCVFSGNLVFDERITELEPNRRLQFDIVRQPDHPEILGHADVLHGGMTLVDNGNGTTTLVGSTAYRLHVYPAAYYDLWAMQIGREVHWSVMKQIRRLAEADR